MQNEMAFIALTISFLPFPSRAFLTSSLMDWELEALRMLALLSKLEALSCTKEKFNP